LWLWDREHQSYNRAGDIDASRGGGRTGLTKEKGRRGRKDGATWIFTTSAVNGAIFGKFTEPKVE
jgi:hypothetical protein